MPERYADFHTFDAASAGEALHAEPRRTRDVAHGAGEALAVQETEVEVYPAAGVARVTRPDARIELYRVPRYAVTPDRLVFLQGEPDDRTMLSVAADGAVLFGPIPEATGSSPAGDTAPRRPPDPPTARAAAETTTAASSDVPVAGTDPEAAEVERMTLQGRLGRDPWFRSGDPPVAGFPLAVNSDEGRTTWHRVVVFDDTVDTLQEQVRRGEVRKGRLVHVTGRHVVTDEDTPRGTKKTTEFHATQVTRVRSTPQR